MENKILTRAAYVRNGDGAINEESRQVEFVISSEAVDSYNTVFKMDGWDLTSYEKNPIVCYNHDSHGNNPDTIIGTSEVFKEDAQLIGRVTFEDAETNPLAEKVFKKVKNGTLRMASIGANILQAHWGEETAGEDPAVLYFTQQRLLEWSVVTIGANPEANKRNAATLEEIRNEKLKETPVATPTVETGKDNGFDYREAQYMLNKNNL